MASEEIAPYVPADVAGVDGDYLIWFARSFKESVAALLDRLDCERGSVYRSWNGGFGAHLDERQLDLVRRVPGVSEVWQDTEGRPAPYRPAAPDDRVASSYIVSVVVGAGPRAVAERNGFVPGSVYEGVFHGFAARMDDVQLDAVRRDPDVTKVEDNLYMTLEN